MKKLYLAGLVFGVASMAAVSAHAGLAAGTGIVGSKHDMNIGSYADDNQNMGRVCVYCHTPHFAKKPGGTLNYSPLWNRDNPAMLYSMYDNGDNPQEFGTVDPDGIPGNDDDYVAFINHNSYAADMGKDQIDPSSGFTIPFSANQPTGVSLMCLSCHDGSVAINAYGSAPSSSYNDPSTDGTEKFMDSLTQYFIGGDALGTGSGDLSNHHPIGFSYEVAAERDDEIKPSDSPMGSNMIADLLNNGNMECNTCHDVHNTKNTGEKFVWVDNTGSAFCIACHDK